MDANPTQSAAQAFEALRAEIAGLRTAQQDIAARSVPDYDLTLGHIARQLEALTDRIARLEARPIGDIVVRQGKQALDAVEGAAAALGTRITELGAAIGDVRSRTMWRRWLIAAGMGGAVLGIVLCLGVATLFPRASGAWMAAVIVGDDPWTTGQLIMRNSQPASFDRMVRLYNACPSDKTTEVCASAIATDKEKTK